MESDAEMEETIEIPRTRTAQPAPKTGLVSKAASVVLWLVVLAAVAYLTKGFWYPSHTTTQTKPAIRTSANALSKTTSLIKDDVSDIKERLQQVEQSLAETKITIKDLPTAAPDTSAMESQVTTLTTTVSALEKQVSALSEKITSLQQQPMPAPQAGATQSQPTAAVPFPHEQDLFALVVAQQLSRKLMLDRDFTKEVELLEKTNDASIKAKVAVLKALDADGVPTLPYLKSSFEKNISNVLSAAAGTDKGVVGAVASKLQSIVTVRRIGDNVEGSDTDAVLARAENALINSDVETAREELKSLPNNLQTILTPWTSEADKRIEAETAVEKILDDLSARVMPSFNPATSPAGSNP